MEFFSIAIGADYSYEVKYNEICAPAFFKHNNSFIGTVVYQKGKTRLGFIFNLLSNITLFVGNLIISSVTLHVASQT